MSVGRQGNWQGQQRVDIPHLRAIESAVAGDFDLLAGSMLAGRRPLITSGFYVLTAGITVATNLKVRVANGHLIHFLASESGSIFHVPADRPDEQLSSTNPRVLGSFTPGQVNYVGLDFVRAADDSTVDLVEFIDTQSLSETPVSIPLARTTDYRIVISTLDFDNNPGVAPICTVAIDITGTITDITDARASMWRLGAGGTVPNIYSSFLWPAGRKESLSSDEFTGGDKGLSNLKDWMDSIMSRLWEVGGGEFWYSPTTAPNERLVRTGDPFVSNGEFFEWDGSDLHWKGLAWVFANSSGIINEVADVTSNTPGLTDLLDGECIYVDVDRTQNRTGGDGLQAVKGTLALLGSPTIPGSRYVIAWAYDSGSGVEIYTRDQSYAVNSTFKDATTVAGGMVKLSATPDDAVYPARVATTGQYGYAYAAGLTRGGDFFAGAGDIRIGGFGAEDHNIIIKTDASNYETRVEATNNWTLSGVSALTVRQSNPFTDSSFYRVLTLQGFDGGVDNQVEDTHAFEACGTQLWKIVENTPGPPPNTSTSPLVAKTYFRTNGYSTPDTRDQYVIMDRNGNVNVLWEGDDY